jgi:hypothetical protein
MPSADQPLKGLVPLLAAVAILSMVTATLRLKLEARIEARSDPPPTAMAMRPPTSPSTVRDLPSPAVFAVAIRPPESTSSIVRDLPSPAVAAIAVARRSDQPPSPATAATTEARDLASPAAAAARAKALVERSVGIPNAKILEPIIAKRIGDGRSVNRAERPRYQTEVVAEIPRGFGTPIQRRYILTLQYVGGDEWRVDGMQFVTRY